METYRNRTFTAKIGVECPVSIMFNHNKELSMRKIFSLTLSIISTVVLMGAFWLFFGNFKVTTTVDGDGVAGTVVKVDGEAKCKTPCKFRLWPGIYDITVDRPEGFEVLNATYTKDQGHKVLTVFWGTDLNYEFESGR